MVVYWIKSVFYKFFKLVEHINGTKLERITSNFNYTFKRKLFTVVRKMFSLHWIGFCYEKFSGE